MWGLIAGSRKRRVGIVLAPAALLVCFLFVFGAAVLGGKIEESSASGFGGSCRVAGDVPREIPQRFVNYYEDAAEQFELGPRGFYLLASIHRIETQFSAPQFLRASSAGALGPMQFIPSTWASYGVDGDKDGDKDIWDEADAIHGAANYLSASGAPGDWRAATWAYNHATWYVDDVLSVADYYAESGAIVCEAGSAEDFDIALGELDWNDTSGAWAGSQKFAEAAWRIAKKAGCTSRTGKRSTIYTASGNISDHWIGQKDAFAYDISGGACVTQPEGSAPANTAFDKAARAIAAAFDLPAWHGLVNAVNGKYRIQLLWRTGGHWDHIHVGVRAI